jgi:hypothetical protein
MRMYCPECGHDAGDAKFCPECGADLSSVRGALKKDGADKRGGAGAAAAEGRGDAGHAGSVPASRGLSPLVIWAVVAVVAVAVVVGAALASSGDDGGGDAQGVPDPASTAMPISVDTSGTYDEIVQRAHELYDRGEELFGAQQIDQGAAYFAAAAQLYEAAWQKKPGDPAVGTDWATSLFYSGDFEGAIKRVKLVLADSPDFQPGWFNLGNYLQHKARMAEMQGEEGVAGLLEEAREAYLKAAEIDPESQTGVEAAARAAQLAE